MHSDYLKPTRTIRIFNEKQFININNNNNKFNNNINKLQKTKLEKFYSNYYFNLFFICFIIVTLNYGQYLVDLCSARVPASSFSSTSTSNNNNNNNNRNCVPIFVRWPRVRLNFSPAQQSPSQLNSCRNACTNNADPLKRDREQQCSAFNYRAGANAYTHECQIFTKDNVQHTDGYVEADDQYSFYWKYCIQTKKSCSTEHAFTFLSDRYMIESEISRSITTKSLENCLAECLNENEIVCRSVSFNRTSGGCYLSEQNQLTKPSLIKINNNPNFRIDYYENNCFNNSFEFKYKCEENGIRIDVDAKLPYTGALYGLYDFFSCRIEPKEEKNFGYLFPYPTVSKNCSDSIRYSGTDVVLEVVLSTDGVEPLYFITADDLTYQARCPIRITQQSSVTSQNDSPQRYSSGEDFSRQSSKKSTKSLEAFIVKSSTVDLQPKTTTTTETTKSTKSTTKQTTTPSTTKTTKPSTTTTTSKPSTTTTTKPSSTTTTKPSTTTTLATLKPSTKDIFPLSQFYPTTTTTTEKKVAATIATTTTIEKDLTIAINKTSFNAKSEPISHKNRTTTTSSKNHGMVAITDPSELRFRSPLYDHYANKSTTTRGAVHEITNLDTNERRLTTTTTNQQKLFTQQNSAAQNFSFSTHLSFPASDKIFVSTTSNSSKELILTPPPPPPTTTTTTTTTPTTTPTTTTTTTTTPSTTTTTLTTTTTINPSTTNLVPQPPGIGEIINVGPPGTTRGASNNNNNNNGEKRPAESVIFDIFHNGQPTEAVVVGSRITLSFTPYFAIPPEYMAISGCQVEPIGSLYEWEKEPLAIVKDGCQSDHVGLVCPPQRTDYGIRVTVESFRYQTTTQVQYTCLLRICPFAPCPKTTCSAVEGCSADDIISRSFGLSRTRRDISLEQIRDAIAANPFLQQQLSLGGNSPGGSAAQPPPIRMNNSLQQQLITLGGDHIVRKRLIVVNTDEELRYYIKTGQVPAGHLRA